MSLLIPALRYIAAEATTTWTWEVTKKNIKFHSIRIQVKSISDSYLNYKLSTICSFSTPHSTQSTVQAAVQAKSPHIHCYTMHCTDDGQSSQTSTPQSIICMDGYSGGLQKILHI